MEWIIDLVFDIAKFFYLLYHETRDWISPFDAVADFFYDIYEAFWDLLDPLQELNVWLENAADELEDILSWSNIRSLIRGWLDGIEDALEWWYSWWSNVFAVVEGWWDTVIPTIQGWIAIATEGFDELVEAWDTFWHELWPELVDRLENLRGSWNFFVTQVLNTLVSFDWLETWWNSRLVDITELINSKLTEWLPFYDDLVSLWEGIKEFFSDPLQWLYNKMDEWFERFW
ncbi:MAG: hypothetical protein HWN68_10925 [Desulfobacterales bacterium]|nr:hypothetical protein [Desulfobacterales bacterium]